MPLLSLKTLGPVKGRTLVIGDVHGCARELETLIRRFQPTAEDRLIALGDLINRGPDNPGVLQLVRQYAIEPLLGNHERRLLKAWQARNPAYLKGRDTVSLDSFDAQTWQWIAGWPHLIRVPSLESMMVHGGFLPATPWRQQDPATVTSVQVIDSKGSPAKQADVPEGTPWGETWKGPEHVFYGHTPRPKPLFHPFATGLDTGCVYGYQLSALSLPERRILQVKARRAYI